MGCASVVRMKYEARTIDLVPEKRLVLRSPEAGDAEALIDYLRAVCGETEFLLCGAEEVTYTAAEERDFITAFLEDERKLLLAVFDGERAIADIGVEPVRDVAKMRHRAKIGISVRKEYWGRGIGSLLLREAERAARGMGYERLELDVFAANSRALSLYERTGFVQCGCIPRAARLADGSYSDEIYMTKVL